ncbi:HTH-type transcriptional regulator PuuR [Variovorax sp. WDL1]|nr:HTH-type transcriptional regulator PuuR [Variovorax sp. B4]PNG60793.1 HTH-type transcriptional regulator PuuR [Variovorax sp. B2]VTV13288.1 HTH-type transcriptional regulator PuuR [Variovorax sp. WDL1]
MPGLSLRRPPIDGHERGTMPRKAETEAKRASVARARKAPAAAVAANDGKAWRRAGGDQTMIHELGLRIRAAREEKALSLAQVSELSGVPGATLSRIENSKMSPTFSVLARIMVALEVDWVDLVGPKKPAPGEPVMSFTEAGGGIVTQVRGERCEVLHSDESAQSAPLLVEVHSRKLSDTGGLVGHQGEEFCYVLSGALALHIEGREPRIMKAGDSALFDSTTPHAYLAATAAGAKILIVVTRPYGSHIQRDIPGLT